MVYPAVEDSRYPVFHPRTAPPPIRVPARPTEHEAEAPGSPDSQDFSDAGETTPLTATYDRQASVTKEYFDARRHPRQSNPFATPFDD